MEEEGGNLAGRCDWLWGGDGIGHVMHDASKPALFGGICSVATFSPLFFSKRARNGTDTEGTTASDHYIPGTEEIGDRDGVIGSGACSRETNHVWRQFVGGGDITLRYSAAGRTSGLSGT